MTAPEFSVEFDKLYDNLATSGAPGVDDYDKSLLLTHAQEDIVKAVYNGSKVIDVLGERFEFTENARRSIDALVKTWKHDFSSPTTDANTNLQSPVADGIFVPIASFPDPEMWWIVEEGIVTTSDTDACVEGLYIPVFPITHDEYNVNIKNPWRQPNKKKAWRLDTSYGLELHTPYEIDYYKARYIEKPAPIIVASLLLASNADLALYYTADLTIDGSSAAATCALNEKLHRPILYLAVQRAIMRYRENNLGNNYKLGNIT